MRRRVSSGDLAIAVAVVAIGLLIVAVARHGVVLTPDSLVYKGVSEQLRAGNGITVPFSTFTSALSPAEVASFDGAIPLTDQPPLYPAMLAVLTAVGLSVDTAVLAINLVALVAIAVLMRCIAGRLMSPTAAAWSTVALLAVFTIGPMSFERDAFASLFASALSEPAMLAFVLGALLALMCHVQDASDRALAVATLLSMCAVLTRFSGVAAPLTIAIVVVLLGAGSRRRRWVTAVVCAVVATLPAVLILGRNQQLLGSSARLFGIHRVGELGGEYRRSVAAMLWPWSAEQGARELLGAAVLLVAVALFTGAWIAARRHRPVPQAGSRVPRTVLTCWCLSYAAVFLASRLLVDATLLPTGRFLVPLLVPLGLLVASSIVSAPTAAVRGA